jgi:threonine dehydrogenase-like Zn-dependent dehydrogenase
LNFSKEVKDMKGLYFDADIKKIALIKALSLFWKRAALSSISPVRYAEVGEPELPGPNWVKVKNRLCGICGSDIHFIFLEIDPTIAPAAVPTITRKFIGHEVVGEVVDVGSGATEFKGGDRVILTIDWPSCFQKETKPKCRECSRGNYLLCEDPGWPEMPKNTGGGFSPYMVVHKTQLMKIDDDIPDEDAILIEPTACSVRAVLKRPPISNKNAKEKVLIIGAGSIGLNMLSVIKAMDTGAEIYIATRYPHQTEMAKKLGATGIIEGKDTYKQVADITGGKYFKAPFGNEMVIGGFNVIYDTVGNDQTLKNAARWARAESTVVIVGINFSPKKLDYSPFWYQEVDLKGINCHGQEVFRGKKMTSFEVAYLLYKEGKLNFDGFVTHTHPMEDYLKGIDLFLNKGKNKTIKVALKH